MSNLPTMKCIACQPGAPTVSEAEKADLSKEVPDWSITTEQGIDKLDRTFDFPDFKTAMEFTLKVGEIAESEDHHPLIQLEWGRVRVFWWSHTIKGLHRNDFIMAAKTDKMFSTF